MMGRKIEYKISLNDAVIEHRGVITESFNENRDRSRIIRYY